MRSLCAVSHTMLSAVSARVRISRCGVVVRVALWCVGAWFVWRSARLRAGRASISLVFFFEDATTPKRGSVHQGRGQAHLRVLLNDRTIRHHRVNVDVPVQERYGNRGQ